MQLKDIEEHPLSSLDYLERIVNNGSKSGFTNIHNTSLKTNPFYSRAFPVKKLIVEEEFIKCYGKLEQHYSFLNAQDFIFIHPDWELVSHAKDILSLGRVEDSVTVIPTSSSRTVRIQESYSYLKLHYPGMIGRLNRELGYMQLISGVNLNEILVQAKQNNLLPELFDFMPESYGRLLVKDNNQIGFILREIPRSIKDDFIIPAFSLFSLDRECPRDEVLLHQILDEQIDAYEFFLNSICFPLIDIFFACVFNEGLIPEMHSQNILFAFGADWNIKKIILRDFESIDKDISIRQGMGKQSDFPEFPYKCIARSDEDYLKRHSFMFDHKLCEYLVEPLVECAAAYLEIDVSVLQKAIKDYVDSKYCNQLYEFFPEDGCWYKYPNEEIDRTSNARPFKSMGVAIYR